MQDQPKPVQIQVHCKGSQNEGRIAVTTDDGRFIGSVTYDVQNPAELSVLAQAFLNAVSSTGPRIQTVGLATAINGKRQ